MRPDAVRDIVLAYAIETAAPSPALPSPERCQAITADTLHALGSGPPPTGGASAASPRFQAFVQQRAARIIQASELPADVRQVWRQSARLAPWVPLAIVAGALLAGFAGHRIADPHRVNLLSLPLLALLAWNLLMYAWLLLHGSWAWLRRTSAAPVPLAPTVPAGADAAAAPAAPATPWWQRLSAKRWRPLRGNPLRKMALAFEKNWWTISRDARQAQWLQWLHLGAAMMALGALASLWATGLTHAYQVGWESTFLSADQVQRLLNTLFWPAQALLHTSPWSLADIQALQGWVANPVAAPTPGAMPEPPSVGAQWVVAYSTLLAAVIVVPRTLLALWQWLRTRWLRRRMCMRLPWQQAYFQNLLRDFGGLAVTLRVTPYNLTPTAERQQVLQAWVQQQHGAGAQLQWQPSVRYGNPLPAAAPNAARGGDGTQPVLLLSLAATPEAEIHGTLLAEAREHWGSGAQVWLWAQDFAERNRGTPRRLQEREQLWREFVQPYGLSATILPEGCA